MADVYCVISEHLTPQRRQCHIALKIQCHLPAIVTPPGPCYPLSSRVSSVDKAHYPLGLSEPARQRPRTDGLAKLPEPAQRTARIRGSSGRRVSGGEAGELSVDLGQVERLDIEPAAAELLARLLAAPALAGAQRRQHRRAYPAQRPLSRLFNQRSAAL